MADDLDEGEVVEDVWCQLSVGQAVSGEDAPHWIQAINKEKTKLEAFKTWRSCTEQEENSARGVVPVAIVLTRKRDGTYKARAVVLGNLYKPGHDFEVYAPVVSFSASRYLLVDAAAAGDFIEIFDIDNAFVQSLIDSDIFVRLPKIWREDNDSGLRKLVRALYGLPQSPRLWAKHYESHLLALGWTQSDEKGLWRKPSIVQASKFLKLGVYVDDNTASGPDKKELRSEVQKVLTKFPGKIIDPKLHPGGEIEYDLLGADVIYHRENRTLKYNMSSYIKEKLCKKFRLEGCRPVDSPTFPESCLYDETSPESNFPLREAVGALQWLVTVCRPDVAAPVNCLAKVTGKKVTKVIANCAKKVMRYLICTPEVGLLYSPENEE
eukprot:g7249.t1